MYRGNKSSRYSYSKLSEDNIPKTKINQKVSHDNGKPFISKNCSLNRKYSKINHLHPPGTKYYFGESTQMIETVNQT